MPETRFLATVMYRRDRRQMQVMSLGTFTEALR